MVSCSATLFWILAQIALASQQCPSQNPMQLSANLLQMRSVNQVERMDEPQEQEEEEAVENDPDGRSEDDESKASEALDDEGYGNADVSEDDTEVGDANDDLLFNLFDLDLILPLPDADSNSAPKPVADVISTDQSDVKEQNNPKEAETSDATTDSVDKNALDENKASLVATAVGFYATWGGQNYGYLTYWQKRVWVKLMAFFKFADTNNTGQLTWNEYWNAQIKIARAHDIIWKIKKAYARIKFQFYYWAARSGYKYLMSRRDVFIWIKRKVGDSDNLIGHSPTSWL